MDIKELLLEEKVCHKDESMSDISVNEKDLKGMVSAVSQAIIAVSLIIGLALYINHYNREVKEEKRVLPKKEHASTVIVENQVADNGVVVPSINPPIRGANEEMQEGEGSGIFPDENGNAVDLDGNPLCEDKSAPGDMFKCPEFVDLEK